MASHTYMPQLREPYGIHTNAVQGNVPGSAVDNQVINFAAVGRSVLSASTYLTSKLHLLAVFNQYLGDDEVGEAYQTYIYCGSCNIELGMIRFNSYC